WGNVGTTGPEGAKGEEGASGSEGTVGVPGQRGSRGPEGEPGATGDPGEFGNNGNVGSRGQKGDPGDTGDPGPDGTLGPKGQKGDIGPRGDNGLEGAVGADGPRGRVGERGNEGFEGPTGASGSRGSKGDRGLQGEDGRGGPSGERGPPGSPAVLPTEFAGQFSFPGYQQDYSDPALLETEKSGSRRLYRSGGQDTETETKSQIDLYDVISYRLDMYKNPNGSQSFPARTCRDLHMSYPELKSGLYWIDPNGGITNDAIKVYCEFQTNGSCLYPGQENQPFVTDKKKWFTGSDGYKWLGKELLGLDKLEYVSEQSQLEFLQLLSDRARQRITYHCKNSVAWPKKSSDEGMKSIKMLTVNGLELHARSSNKFKPTLVGDDCTVKDGSWHRTTLEVDTPKPHRLPVLDVAVYDIGDSGEEFGLEFGRVCFS
ncbi:collagen alpha-2(I) chain-like, partial [Stylophora pistillata]|uniref:collagen alpha-2(I) chain-like n=1 Tax=Stylophora pistillata TaxID=50429 RepID=UPI000C040291